MGRKADTKKENEIIEYIVSWINEKGVAPSVREMAQHFDCMPSNIQRYLDRLEAAGKITRNGTRQIVTKYNDSPIVRIPLIGEVSCGTPLLAEQNIDCYLPMSKEFIGDGTFFALTCKGESMIEAGIEPGDVVIVKQQSTAEIGQIVVALVDDDATLKRYFINKKEKKIVLHPENSTMSDMIFDKVAIQGVAVKVIKNIK